MTTTNRSGLRPLGHAVLVMPYDHSQGKEKSKIVLPDTVKERSQMVENRVVVIEIGPAAWDDEKEPRAKVGDKVLITKMAGAMAIGTLDNKVYRVVNDRDIYTRIEEEA